MSTTDLENPKLQMSFATIDAIDTPVLSISLGFPAHRESDGTWTTGIECTWETSTFKKDLWGTNWFQSLSSAMRFASIKVQAAIERYRGSLVFTGEREAILFHNQAIREVRSAMQDWLEIRRETFIPSPMGCKLDGAISPLPLEDYERWWNGLKKSAVAKPEASHKEVLNSLLRSLTRFDFKDSASEVDFLGVALRQSRADLIGFESSLGPQSAFRIQRQLLAEDVIDLQQRCSPNWIFSSLTTDWVLAVGSKFIFSNAGQI